MKAIVPDGEVRQTENALAPKIASANYFLRFRVYILTILHNGPVKE